MPISCLFCHHEPASAGDTASSIDRASSRSRQSFCNRARLHRPRKDPLRTFCVRARLLVVPISRLFCHHEPALAGDTASSMDRASSTSHQSFCNRARLHRLRKNPLRTFCVRARLLVVPISCLFCHHEPASAGGTMPCSDFFPQALRSCRYAALFLLSSRGGLQADEGSAV